MKKAAWKRKIKEATKAAGTYEEYFDNVIDTLAQMLEDRDTTREAYIRTGANPVIAHTNKGGATNLVKNPLLVVINDINGTALAYWRDLGLTPAGFKKLTGTAPDAKKKEGGGLEDILKRLDI